MCLDSARVWLLCQAIDAISVLLDLSLCRVLANPVTFSEEITCVFLLQMAFHRELEPLKKFRLTLHIALTSMVNTYVNGF